MKIVSAFFVVLACLIITGSCQRELNFDDMSIGVLKKDQSGNCLPVTIAGSFKADSLLTGTNFAEVQADVRFPGKYLIYSDTVNGFYFRQSGKVGKGLNTIRLPAEGKPLRPGIVHFVIHYGESTCSLSVNVGGPEPAVYTLSGAPGTCLAGFADGTYIEGTPLTVAHTLTVDALVTRTGTYTISTATLNGMSFSGSGVFTGTGAQPVLLKGTGTPLKAEITNIPVLHAPGNCTLPVTVNPQGFGEAQYSFDGTPGNCVNPDVKGNYYAGITSDITHTVTLNVTVARTGSYTLHTNAANGLSFNGAGVFTTTGPQTVTLAATGTPLKAETTSYIPNTGTAACNFSVLVQPLPPPAVLTLSGAPGSCSPATVNGFYISSKPLDAANTVIIKADVAVAGSYTIITNTVNGFSFAATGVFAGTGLQTIVLRGTGTPQVAGPAAFTPRYGASLCGFTVPVQ